MSALIHNAQFCFVRGTASAVHGSLGFKDFSHAALVPPGRRREIIPHCLSAASLRDARSRALAALEPPWRVLEVQVPMDSGSERNPETFTFCITVKMNSAKTPASGFGKLCVRASFR